MGEKTIEINGLPIFPISSEFNISVYYELLAHAVEHKISLFRAEPSAALLAVFGGETFDLDPRPIFGFEIAGIVDKLVQREDRKLLDDAGRLQTTEYYNTDDDKRIAYSRVIQKTEVGEYQIEVTILKEIRATVESTVVIKGDFAGKHDGTIYDLEGYLNKDSFDDLLKWAGDRKASDITIQPDCEIMAEIGGELCKITPRPISSSEIEECVRYVYGENGPAEVLAGHDLDPSHEVRLRNQSIRRYRVNITGGRIIGGMGMQMTIRTLPSSPIPIDKLGVEPELLKATRPTNGIIFICGPTGSGKSTLMSSIVRMIVERKDANEKVLEFSQPIEYVFDEVEMPSSIVFQTHVGRHLKPREKGENQWAYAARNSLRRKPTLIILGEARDAETIEEAVKISQEGHLTYSTMHTNSVAETINRAINVFPFEVRDRMSIDLMGSLRMIVVQILVARVGGGKIACREFMVFDPKTRERFLKTKMTTWPVLIQRMLTEQQCVGKTMLSSALELLKDGKITMETFEQIAEKGGQS